VAAFGYLLIAILAVLRVLCARKKRDGVGCGSHPVSD
jgi:hypothetical protein